MNPPCRCSISAWRLRVELDGGVEVGEEDDQAEQDQHVPDADLAGRSPAQVAVDPTEQALQGSGCRKEWR